MEAAKPVTGSIIARCHVLVVYYQDHFQAAKYSVCVKSIQFERSAVGALVLKIISIHEG
ncbi:hypothetical protein [Noviherbaspirillum sedimenti]|nr:hypothetical protein [Noviherbaspirillum sedimenti]